MFKNINHRFKVTLITFAFLILLLFLMTNFPDNRANKNQSLIDKNEFFDYSSDPTSELGIYYKVRDSIFNITQWRNDRTIGRGSSINCFLFGIKDIYECDSCFSIDDHKYHTAYKKKYFMQLNGFTLKNNFSFKIDKDKYYIEKIYLDKPGDIWTKKEITVRYSPGYPPSYKDGALLIPVSKKTYDVLKTIVWLLYVLTALIMFYVLFILPAKVLMTIAAGNPFTKTNVKRLNITGWTILIGALIPPLISILIEWTLSKRIPNEIYYPFIQSVFDYKFILAAGLIVLLIANAFRHGYNLQQEQDLTI